MYRSGRSLFTRRLARSSPAQAGHDARQRILARRQYPPQPGRLEDAARPRDARRHPAPHRAGRNRRHRGDRRSSRRGTQLAREPPDQGRLAHGQTAHSQDAGRLRLLVPAIARPQPIMALAGLDFINRAEVIHLLGPPGTGKSHLATALAVEAVRAGKSVYFIPLADLVAILAKVEREGALREKIRFLCRCSLLVVDEIGYLPG